MTAITETDKMNFRTQIVDGKPRIFFDSIDDSSIKTRSKRNSRAINNVNRLSEQKTKTTQRQSTRPEQRTNNKRVNEDGTGLGVYMTMDELAELVNAVKENAKSEIDVPRETETKAQQYNETIPAPVVPRLDLVLEPPPLPPSQISPRDEALNQMAEKKRQKWVREKAEIERMQLEIEYDKLKHQLSPRHKKNPTSPQRSTFQYDFPPSTNKPPLAPTINKPLPVNKPPPPPPSSLPQSFKQNDYQYDISPTIDEEPNPDVFKTRLMEKKQQQWKQENSEKAPFWDPFGRPGAGAPKTHENQPRTSQPPTNTNLPYRPSLPQQQPFDNSSSYLPHNDQSRIPAAMRTNLAFGNGRQQEDIKTVQEIERRQWLDDLHKQIEENKRKKYASHESERRQDFLRDNVQPLIQEAANRHQQPTEMSTTNYHTGQDLNRFHQHDSSVQPKTLPGPTSNKNTGENIFGPTYDSPSKQNTNNVGIDRQHPYRPLDARRDEAVNTVDTTFRSDHGIQTDLRIPPNRRMAPYAYEDSDLPPQAPNHHYRNPTNQPGKKTVRMRSLDDNQLPPRHTSTTNLGAPSQMNSHRTNQSPTDIQHRPLWNYNNHKRAEYIPNSKRDPNYEKRQRLKQIELGNYDHVDDVQKKTCYNRWNSDSEIQQKKQHPMNRTRSTMSKATGFGNPKDESIMNLLKGQNKQPEVYGTRYPPSNHTKTDNEYNSNQPSSVDRYENDVQYTRPDEGYDPTKVYSQSIEAPSHKQIPETNTNNNYQPREWENTNRQNPVVQPTQYSVPQTKQEHILQQLSTIKENLMRRQRELASPVNVIQV